MKGGTFQNYNDKTYLKLTDLEISKHLNGEQLIGVYPLLQDNTSNFIVADFDEANWIDDAKKFLKACNDKNIPAYLERSRSGNGGHVWIFFDQPYPAIRSRKILISILEQSGTFSVFDKSSSFDRLFPNQDFLSGKGLGNLIALPLFKKTLEQGNSCFIDTETFQPIKEQFEFLKNIERISISELENLYQSLAATSNSTFQKVVDGKMIITLNNEVKISRDGMTTPLINFLKEELNFTNSEFSSEKIAYFLQRFGARETFKLEFQPNFYGPYSGRVKHVLYYLNGSYIMGYSSKDKKPFEELSLIPDAEIDVIEYLDKVENFKNKTIVEKTKNFLTGFYSPFGLELLSTIDFIIVEKNITNKDAITMELQNWSDRKKTLFTNPKFIQIALDNLNLHLEF